MLSVKTPHSIGLLFFVVMLLGSCATIKPVNKYSTESLEGLQNFEQLTYSFVQACNDKCLVDQLEKKELFKADCACGPEERADSVTLSIYLLLKSYLEGLKQLSASDLTNYSYEGLTGALTQGKFGSLTLNEKHVNAFGKLSTSITKAITDRYRHKKLALFIGDGNDAFNTTLDALHFNLESNLSGRLDTRKELLRSYMFDLFNAKDISEYEKKKIIEEHNAQIADIEQRKKQLALYSKSLKVIAEGHQQLYNNRNNLTDKKTMKEVSAVISELEAIVTALKTLKNKL